MLFIYGPKLPAKVLKITLQTCTYLWVEKKGLHK